MLTTHTPEGYLPTRDEIDLGLYEPTACEHCGEALTLDVFEFWTSDHAWQFDTCCEAAHADFCEDAAEDPKGFARWFEVRTGTKAKRCYDSGLALRIDFGLTLEAIDLKTAKAFIAEHHRHNEPPKGWRWGHAVFNGSTLIAVATVGRPVARMIDGKTVVEVTRLCVAQGLDRELAENACSLLYSAAAREARRRGFARIITYTLETELATSVRAASWLATHRTRGGSWNRPSRSRTDKAPTCRKIRWEKGLNKLAARDVSARSDAFQPKN